jgi:hypothetical protein
MASSVDDFQHTLQFLVDLRIPESQYQPAMRLQIVRAQLITVFNSEMGFAVQFHDHFAFDTSEIGEEGPDGMLAAEFNTGETAVPHFSPQNAFGRRELSAELTCALSSARIA